MESHQKALLWALKYEDVMKTFLKRIEARFIEVKALDDDYDDEIEEDEQPDEDDAIFTPSGHLGSKISLSAGGKHIGEFNSNDEAEKALVEWINHHKWFPNIWEVSDHGNARKYTLSKQNSKKIKM